MMKLLRDRLKSEEEKARSNGENSHREEPESATVFPADDLELLKEQLRIAVSESAAI